MCEVLTGELKEFDGLRDPDEVLIYGAIQLQKVSHNYLFSYAEYRMFVPLVQPVVSEEVAYCPTNVAAAAAAAAAVAATAGRPTVANSVLRRTPGDMQYSIIPFRPIQRFRNFLRRTRKRLTR